MLLTRQNVFLYHLAFNTYNTKVQQITSVSPLSEKAGETIDLKGCLSHIVMFARTYALQNRIWETNTVERLNTLKSKQIVACGTIDEIIYVYNFMMKLRLKNQVKQIENHAQISNLLNTKFMAEPEFSHLKKILTMLPAYQNKISLDFRLKS
jgi:CBS domain-containing protein